MATYVVSDLHGRYEIFLKGLEKINFGEKDFLYVLGDAIDRGPDGVKLLLHVMEQKNMDLIMGNHEFMMLNSVSPDGSEKCQGEDSDLWRYYNGGYKTYEQYVKLSREKRKEILDWLEKRLVIKTIQVGEEWFCLTHSNYDPHGENMPYCDLDHDVSYDIVWKSIFRSGSTWMPDVYSDYKKFTFITGHVPIQRAFRKNLDDVSQNGVSAIRKGNLIDIDGGCAMGDLFREAGIGGIFLRLDDLHAFLVPLE